jgi:acetolactate synthase-1/2/3 large subunit
MSPVLLCHFVPLVRQKCGGLPLCLFVPVQNYCTKEKSFLLEKVDGSNHQKLFEPVTLATFRLSVENVREVMESSMRICKGNYPGPVHIGLPSDISDIEISEAGSTETIIKDDFYHNDIQRITSILEKARRPILAIGLTAIRLNIGKELVEFLIRYKMPVVITPMAKGIISEKHPCYAGVLFHSLSDYLEDIYEKTDLVIGLGYDPVEFNYESWIPHVPLIHFDTKETDMPDYDSIVQYVGPPGEWFALLKNLEAGLDQLLSFGNGFLGRTGSDNVSQGDLFNTFSAQDFI